MAGRVKEGQREPPDLERVVIVHRRQVGAEAGEELALGLVDAHLRLHAPEELLEAGDAPRHPPRLEAPTHVVLVGVGDQDVGDRHAVGLGGPDDRVDLPRRVHDDTLAALGITDEIDEVLHRPEFHLLEVDRARAHALHRIPPVASALEWGEAPSPNDAPFAHVPLGARANARRRAGARHRLGARHAVDPGYAHGAFEGLAAPASPGHGN